MASDPDLTVPAGSHQQVGSAPKASNVPALPEVPATRGADHINVLVRDPESAFVYWELTPDGVARARAQLAGQSQSQQILRLYLTDAAGNATTQDVSSTDWLGRYVFEPGRPGARLVAAIGYLADGVFVHVVQSRPVLFPRRSPGASPVAFSTLTDGGWVEPAEVDLSTTHSDKLRPEGGASAAQPTVQSLRGPGYGSEAVSR